MKNITVKPLEKKVIQPYGVEDPGIGEKWAADAKIFFKRYPIGTQFKSPALLEAAKETLPHWLVNAEGDPIELTVSEVVKRLNLGGGNKNFGEPRLQLFWHVRSRSFLAIDAVELIDQINVALSMAKTGQRKQAHLEYALQIATSQMKLELSAEQQEEVLAAYTNEAKGVELVRTWADQNTKTLNQAVHAVLGDGANEPNGDQGKLMQRNKK